MNATSIAANAVPLVHQYRQAGHATTPIVMVEATPMGNSWAVAAQAQGQAQSSAALRGAFDQLVAAGDANLYYVNSSQLFSPPSMMDTPCANGLHPTDQGMIDVADFWIRYLPTIIQTGRR